MTEKEKMIRGEMYDANDPQLLDETMRAEETCKKFNNMSPRDREGLDALLCGLMNVAPGSIMVRPPFCVDYGYNITIGEGTYINYGCTILDVCKVTIGKNVLIAPNVQILAATHPVSAVERASGKEFGKPVTIGDNVWLGAGVIVCPGVTIGSNTTIGAGAVVTKDIPADCVAAGNPCRVIRNL